MKTEVTLQQVVSLLNEMVKIDQNATSELFGHWVICNKQLADHPTIQVHPVCADKFSVGLLGVLNGMFGTDNNMCGGISMIVQGTLVLGFQITEGWFK